MMCTMEGRRYPCPADCYDTSGRVPPVELSNVLCADLPEYDQTSDAIQLRPFEVLCEVRL